jgi:hypothetical protein
MPPRKSRLLVVTTRSWAGIEPFLRSLEKAGFAVALVYGQVGGHVLHDASLALFQARPMQFRHTIERVMQNWSPELVVPTDRVSFEHLREIYAMRSEAGRVRSPIARTIAKSLGDPAGYDPVASSADLHYFAREHGLPVPNSVEVDDEATLRVLLESVPLPVMLKGDRAWAGSRAESVRSLEAGVAAYYRVTGATQVAKLWKEQNKLHRLSDLLQTGPRTVSLQQYIDGVSAKRSVTCRDGRVLAGVSVEPLDVTGPTPVAKIVRHSAMDEIAAFVVGTLNLSGYVGFDFMLEHGTRQAWLIAVKPYATPISQLAAAGAVGLPEALYAGFAGMPDSHVADAAIAPFARADRRDARAAVSAPNWHVAARQIAGPPAPDASDGARDRPAGRARGSWTAAR